MSVDDFSHCGTWVVEHWNKINVKGLELYSLHGCSYYRTESMKETVNEKTYQVLLHNNINLLDNCIKITHVLLLHLFNVYQNDFDLDLEHLFDCTFIDMNDVIIITKALRYHELKHKFIYSNMRIILLRLVINNLRNDWHDFEEDTHGIVFNYLLTGFEVTNKITQVEDRCRYVADFFCCGSVLKSINVWNKYLLKFLELGLLKGGPPSSFANFESSCPEAIQQLCILFPVSYVQLGIDRLAVQTNKMLAHILFDYKTCKIFLIYMAHDGIRQKFLYELSLPVIHTGSQVILKKERKVDPTSSVSNSYDTFRSLIHCNHKQIYDKSKNLTTLLATNTTTIFNNDCSKHKCNGILTQSMWFYLKQTSSWYSQLPQEYEVEHEDLPGTVTIKDHLHCNLLENHNKICLLIKILYTECTSVLYFIVDILANTLFSSIHPNTHVEDRKYLLSLIVEECKPRKNLTN